MPDPMPELVDEAADPAAEPPAPPAAEAALAAPLAPPTGALNIGSTRIGAEFKTRYVCYVICNDSML